MDPIDHLEKKLRSLKVDDYEIYARELHQRSVEAKEGQIPQNRARGSSIRPHAV